MGQMTCLDVSCRVQAESDMLHFLIREELLY